jgi:hypothetical protein
MPDVRRALLSGSVQLQWNERLNVLNQAKDKVFN